MLPKISSALVKFIAPLTSPDRSTAQERDQERNRDSQARSEDPEHSESPKRAPVIPINEAAKAALDAQTTQTSGEEPLHGELAAKQQVPSAPANEPGGPSVAHAFVQLLNSFKDPQNGGGVLKWFGTRTYQKSNRSQTGARKSKKGAMLDDEIK
ncbi:hypothetical protein WDW86_07570 [Bdellovibrionota bacterium FG-2]